MHALVIRDVPEDTLFVMVGKKGFFLVHKGKVHKVAETNYHNNVIRITTKPFRGKIKPRQKKCVVVLLGAVLPSQAEIVVHPGGKKLGFHSRVVSKVPALTGREHIAPHYHVSRADEED